MIASTFLARTASADAELRGKNSPEQVSAEQLPQKGATLGTFWALALGKVDLYSKLGKKSNSI